MYIIQVKIQIFHIRHQFSELNKRAKQNVLIWRKVGVM